MEVRNSIRTKLYPVIRRVSARDAAGKIPGRANKLNTASEMTAGCIIYTRGLFHGADGGFNALQRALSRSLYNAITLLGGWHPV